MLTHFTFFYVSAFATKHPKYPKSNPLSSRRRKEADPHCGASQKRRRGEKTLNRSADWQHERQGTRPETGCGEKRVKWRTNKRAEGRKRKGREQGKEFFFYCLVISFFSSLASLVDGADTETVSSKNPFC